MDAAATPLRSNVVVASLVAAGSLLLSFGVAGNEALVRSIDAADIMALERQIAGGADVNEPGVDGR